MCIHSPKQLHLNFNVYIYNTFNQITYLNLIRSYTSNNKNIYKFKQLNN